MIPDICNQHKRMMNHSPHNFNFYNNIYIYMYLYQD